MILVTGATGLLGRFVVNQFLSQGHSVIALKRSSSKVDTSLKGNIEWMDADVRDAVTISECIQKATTVVHAAASVSFDPRAKDEIFQTNVLGTKHVVDACLTHGIKKLIHVSSVAALGRKKGTETIDESTQWVESPLNSDYAKSKYLAELEVYRGMEEGLHTSIVNPSFILAPVAWDKSSSKIFNYVWNESKFYSGGTANYVDVADVVDIIYKLYKTNFNGERFIASAGSIAYRDLFMEIAKRFGKKSPSLQVTNSLLPLFARLEEGRSWLTGKEPLISRESIKSAQSKSVYSNKKAVDQLGALFKPLSQTLDTCCNFFLTAYTTKKS